jgi:hypothetical protein
MKTSFIVPVLASLGLAIPAFAQTSPTPATQEPAMQDQSTPAPHAKAKTRAHKRMAKHKHAKAKPAAPADDQAAPQ